MMSDDIAEDLGRIASEILSAENLKDQASAAESVADLVEKHGHRDLAARIREEAVEWLKQAGLAEDDA